MKDVIRKFDALSIIMILLTLSVCGTFAAAVVASVIHDSGLSTEKLKAIGVLMAPILSILTLYVGAKMQQQKDAK